MITRAQKAETVAALADRFGRAKAAFLVDFKGMNVEEVTTLRKTLGGLEAEMKVVRNTLARLAVKEHPSIDEALSSQFVGTNAVIFAYGDASAPAKALTDFAKDVEELVLKTGVMEGKALDENRIKYLATLPSKEELRAKLLGTLQAPMSKLLGTFSAVPGGFVRVLNAYKETK
ncbi:MAG: 50S ribosomal protein L10 [Pseudobdellovibrionaceae bacterium]|nr:50S ribosomal protein L10 [Bdellovibrionales bacterium]USN46283.1 MAG: 50S ribosomal protein L10 [Pseudobdellovibrionaceae bacterium]